MLHCSATQSIESILKKHSTVILASSMQIVKQQAEMLQLWRQVLKTREVLSLDQVLTYMVPQN